MRHFLLAALQSKSLGLCFQTVLIMVWMRERSFGVGGCKKTNKQTKTKQTNKNKNQGILLFFFFIYYYFLYTTQLYAPIFTASPVQPHLLSVGSSLCVMGEVRAERGSRDGCRRVGWSEQMPSRKFLPERTACLVTPLFLQVGIVYTLINKLYLGLAGWHVSTMEIISVRGKMCLCVKQFLIKLLSLCNS